MAMSRRAAPRAEAMMLNSIQPMSRNAMFEDDAYGMELSRGGNLFGGTYLNEYTEQKKKVRL